MAEMVRLGVELVAEVVLPLAGTEKPEHAVSQRRKDAEVIRVANWQKVAGLNGWHLCAERGKWKNT
jgi:hypothetical protein